MVYTDEELVLAFYLERLITKAILEQNLDVALWLKEQRLREQGTV